MTQRIAAFLSRWIARLIALWHFTFGTFVILPVATLGFVIGCLWHSFMLGFEAGGETIESRVRTAVKKPDTRQQPSRAAA